MGIRKLSIVSPVYKAENIVDELVRRIVVEAEQITLDYEIILVEDGGGDNSWQKIEANCVANPKVKGIKLGRNFGQHYAITAGLEYSKGKTVIIMDCDLQDNPASIHTILDKMKEGFDIVFTKRIKRSHGFFKEFSAKLYNYFIGVFADKNFDVNTGSMIGVGRNAVNAFLQLKEKDRLYIQLFKWVGFRQAYVYVAHDKRFEGKSTYSLGRMISLAVQGLTSHSNKLLKLSVYLGFLLATCSFLVALVIVVLYFVKGFSPGWPSLFVAISFATGVILVSNGILGLYIGKTFEQSKNRPLFIIEKHIDHERQYT
ncbi:MAG TPA: glycosyltransferase family 2 protein [Flavipsychrobacter sp.]|nr:glycosyltransferase family 2 protein [Flavipsychrobacter sp.]